MSNETVIITEHLKNLKNHPMISNVTYESTYRKTFYHTKDSMRKSYNSEIGIFTYEFESAYKIRKFIEWISYALNNNTWKKQVGENIYYHGEYNGVKVTIYVRVIDKPLKKLSILQSIAGCELVERYETYTSKTYTCERK